MFDGWPVQGDGTQVEDTGGAAQHVRRQPDLAGDGAEYPPTEDWVGNIEGQHSEGNLQVLGLLFKYNFSVTTFDMATTDDLFTLSWSSDGISLYVTQGSLSNNIFNNLPETKQRKFLQCLGL